MSDELAPAIAVFERIIADAERKIVDARSAINALLQAQGLAVRYSEEATQVATVAQPAGSPIPAQIKRDTFYGKRQMTAIRELLEMRRAQGEGPATPREVVNALKAGGYRFEAKSDEIALVGVRALMRKATTVFHKLPGTNAYGLTAWYPNAKAARPEEPGARATVSPKGATHKGAPAKVKATKSAGKHKRQRDRSSQKSALSAFVEDTLADGNIWTVDQLLTAAVNRRIEGATADQRTKFKVQGALMVLGRTRKAQFRGDGAWQRIAPDDGNDDDRVVPIKGVA